MKLNPDQALAVVTAALSGGAIKLNGPTPGKTPEEVSKLDAGYITALLAALAQEPNQAPAQGIYR